MEQESRMSKKQEEIYNKLTVRQLIQMLLDFENLDAEIFVTEGVFPFAKRHIGGLYKHFGDAFIAIEKGRAE